MNSIGGNITAQIQVKKEVGKNRMGEKIMDWTTIHEPKGFLDLSNGDSRYTTYNAKVQESTHIFLCDYFQIDKKVEDKRVLIDGQVYDLKFIDDPMGMHEHLEIFLASVG